MHSGWDSMKRAYVTKYVIYKSSQSALNAEVAFMITN